MEIILAADSETELNHTEQTLDNTNDNTNKLPRTHVKWSILNLICSICCIYGLVFNLAAFNYSFKTKTNIQNGNLNKAKQNSKLAKKFNIIVSILFICGVMLILGWILVINSNPFLLKQIPKFWSKTLQITSPSNKLNHLNLNESSNQINIVNSIQGMWKLKERDNYEQYLHLLGVNYFSKLFVVNLKPVVEFNVFNDVWTVNVTTSLKSKTDKFKLGVEFDEEMLQIKFKTTYKLEGNKLIKQQINEQNKVITSLEITADDLLYSVAQIKNAKTTAYFERTKVNDYDQ